MNASGIEPFDTKILVQIEKIEEKTKGGILLAPQTIDAEKYASVRANVIAVGANACQEWGASAAKPVAGDKVMIAKYAGVNVKGVDGEEYRLCNDEDIAARISE